MLQGSCLLPAAFPGNALKLTSELAKTCRAKLTFRTPWRIISLTRHRLCASCSIFVLPSIKAFSACPGVSDHLRRMPCRWQEMRRPRADKQLLSLLLPDDGSVGPSAAEPRLRRMLSILAEAHLLVVRRSNEGFLAYALVQHHDSAVRGPTLQKILKADKPIWSTISGLVRDHS